MKYIFLLILFLLNGFFALSEIALVSSKRSRLEQKRVEGSKGAKVALKMLDNSEGFLSAIQVGITLIGIITGAYGGTNIANDVAPLFEKFTITAGNAYEIALILTVLVITYVSIVIGELVPKTIALGNPENIAVRVAPIILFLSRLFYPFVRLLTVSTNFVNKLIGIEVRPQHLTEAELRQMIKIASSEGIIEKEQNIIHEKVFFFSDKKAKHIMTHRTDVEWVDLEESYDEIIESLFKAQHSKVICCNGELDEFKGVIYLKDFFKFISSKEKININDIIAEPLIVPENIDAQKVLTLLRQRKTHICCVVNEYGGFEGLITLHDILENIIGQVPGEGETYEPDIFIREDKSVLVSGEAPIEVLLEIIEDFDIDFDMIDYSTVAGFVFNKIDKIPQIGDSFEYHGYKFEIVDIDGNKIDKILVAKKKLGSPTFAEGI